MYMSAQRSKFIVFDGIAGSGKTTMIAAVKKWLEHEGARIFDLAEWSQKHADPPTFEDVKDFDVLLTFEPTKQWIGRAIRYEMSQTEQPYSGLALAQAFSLDRLVQYNRLIGPARAAGKIIIQDRSITSSIVYQPIMKDGLSLEELLELPGNKLALEQVPDHLVLTQINVDTLQQRHQRRDDSKGVFENIAFLKKVQKRFHADWFQKLFTEAGTQIQTINTNIPIKEMKKTAINYVQSYISR